MIECDTNPPSDDDQYFVLAQDKDKEEEEDNGVTSYWRDDDYDWSLDDIPSNNKKFSWDITVAIRIWEPLKDEDWSVELRILFKEENKDGGSAA